MRAEARDLWLSNAEWMQRLVQLEVRVEAAENALARLSFQHPEPPHEEGVDAKPHVMARDGATESIRGPGSSAGGRGVASSEGECRLKDISVELLRLGLA